MSPLTLSLVVLVLSLEGCVAPFPETHPYHFLNPWIDPWWENLNKAERKEIYGQWERVEPLALALADAVQAKDQVKDLFKKIVDTKTKHFKAIVNEAAEAVKGEHYKGGSTPYESSSDYLGAELSLEHDALVKWKEAAKEAKKTAVLEKLHLLTDKTILKDIVDSAKIVKEANF